LTLVDGDGIFWGISPYKDPMMHALRTAVEAAVEAGLDFVIVVGGDRPLRLKMGLPPTVVDRQPLLLAFEARYHRYSAPMPDDVGLSCELSFDALYHCRIPWSAVMQFAINHPGDGSWPAAWAAEGEATTETEAPAAPTATPAAVDNIRQFRPRGPRGKSGGPG
jgi:hypothetical protein